MANPAELLNAFLSSIWAHDTVTSPASFTRQDDDSLTRHRLCVGYLSQIEEILEAMEKAGQRTTIYRKNFTQWSRTVFNFPNDWNKVDPGCPEGAKDVLGLLADAMDSYVPKLDEEKLDELEKYLDTVDQELRNDESLSSPVRDGALAFVENLRTLIDSYTVIGDFELERALQTLLGNLAIITLRSQHKSGWKNLIDNFMIPYATDQLPSLPVGDVFSSITGQ